MGKPITGHVDLVFPSKYLKAADLRGRDVTIAIDAVEWENLIMVGGKRDTKPAITMRTLSGKPIEKKWIAPKTVLKQIAAATGEKEVGKWRGHKVTIYPDKCRGADGGQVECIRVRTRTARVQEEPPAEVMAPVEQKALVDELDAAEKAEGSAT